MSCLQPKAQGDSCTQPDSALPYLRAADTERPHHIFRMLQFTRALGLIWPSLVCAQRRQEVPPQLPDARAISLFWPSLGANTPPLVADAQCELCTQPDLDFPVCAQKRHILDPIMSQMPGIGFVFTKFAEDH